MTAAVASAVCGYGDKRVWTVATVFRNGGGSGVHGRQAEATLLCDSGGCGVIGQRGVASGNGML